MLATEATLKAIADALSAGTETTGATAANQTNGSQKTQVVDGLGNVAPAGDAVGRAGFVKVTDGTNTQPAADAAARALFAKVTDGTNTQPTGDAAARAIFVKRTDGTNTTPAGDAATRPGFVELSDGTNPVGTSGNPLRVNPTAAPASASTDAGQVLTLNDTNAHAFASSAAATIGVLVSAPAENTATVYVALGSGVTTGQTGTGIPLVPGKDLFFPGVTNSNLIYARTATATQYVKALAI